MFDSIDQLRAAFKQNEEKSTGDYPNNYYPFWRMNDGQQAVVRFLPDANNDNPMDFFVEKSMHNLIINGEKKSVPCMTMYGEKDCPICKVSSAFYKKSKTAQIKEDHEPDENEQKGKAYWRKKQYLMQALVVEDPLPPNQETGETYEGKVCCIAASYQLYNIIKEASMSGELDTIPYKFKDGVDFIIKKTPQGKWSTYTVGSGFKRKNRDLTAEEIAVAKEGMIDLSSLLPKRPDVDTLERQLSTALNENVEDDDDDSSAASNALDFGDFGESEEDASTNTSVDVDDDNDEDAEDILAQIRNRKGKQAS